MKMVAGNPVAAVASPAHRKKTGVCEPLWSDGIAS